MADINFLDYQGIIGNPTNYYQQTYNDTCAIKSQQIILNEFGIPVTEDQLIQYSTEHGWYNGNGTQFTDIGKLLADAGIPCTQTSGATKYDLVRHLADGHKVIVCVDSGELWEGGMSEWLEDVFGNSHADHALIVAGIDNTDPNNPMVILTDPGSGQPAQPYPLDQFMDAWKDSGNFMVSTDVPSPANIEMFQANGQMDMHLPEISGVPYHDFQNFQCYSHMIDPTQFQMLNNAFHAYPTMDVPDFPSLMETFGLPEYNTGFFFSNVQAYDPMTFDYQGLYNMNWLQPADTGISDFDIIQHQHDVLTDLHNDAMDQAQFCMDHGMYSSAQMWTNQAQDIQNDIDNL